MTCSMTTTVDKDNSTVLINTLLQSLLKKICCIIENVDNIGFMKQQIDSNE